MARGSRRRGAAGGGEHESNERWLLTYADMITLLLALFVVLFSISSVNVSKFVSLQESLKAAFSGSILSGGSSILESGADSTSHNSPNNTIVPAIVPLTPTIPKPTDAGAEASASPGHRAAQGSAERLSGAIGLCRVGAPDQCLREGPRMGQPSPRPRSSSRGWS